MKAGSVMPGQKDSARIIEMEVPQLAEDEVLVKILEVGIDGTDIDIDRGQYGQPPPSQDFLVLGHEVLGEVENLGTPEFSKGDLVVPLVRRPDGCINCRNGQSDMCLDGLYQECGIKGANGFLTEYIAEQPQYLIKVPEELRGVGVLAEPMSIATKGISQAIKFHHRSANPIQVALVLGAGPLGLLATAFLRVQNINTYTLDIVPKSNLKGQLVEAIGATYLDGSNSPITELPHQIGNLDIVVEATGNSTVAFQAMSVLGTNGVLCLMGVSTGEKPIEVCADCLNMQMVLGNKMVFGTVSSNRSHFEEAVQLLSEIERQRPGWLSRLITRRLTINDFESSLKPVLDGIKTVIELV
ncbi:glucose 1-dehydrogenase [Chloroflexota bacterium]